jgi:hypothetical protein
MESDDLTDISKFGDKLASSSSPTPANKKPITCIDLFDRMMYCGTPVNQLDKYYRTGDIEECGGYLSDLATCMHAKTIRDERLRQVKNTLLFHINNLLRN